VFGGVFVLRRVATANVPAYLAKPKVHPGITYLQAFFAALRVWRHVLNLIEM
jgi:hypothetical protein